MPTQRIPDLGSIGLNTDRHPYELPPQAWTKAWNVETSDGKIRSVQGEQRLFDLEIKPSYHTSYLGAGGAQSIAVSDGKRVHMYSIQGTKLDISPSPTVDWASGAVSFTNLNGVLVVNSASDGPFYWPGGSAVLLPLVGWDTSWRCKAMVAYRYYLVALGMTESSVDYLYKVRWSNSAAEGDLPTEWVAALDNDAGGDLLGETPGAIVGGALVRDSLYVVKEDAVYSGDWIGGEYVIQFSRLKGAGIGTRLQRGFAEMPNGMVIFSTSDVVMFDGQSSSSIVDGRIRKALSDAISGDLWDLSQVFAHRASSQLFIAGVGAGYTQLSHCFVYNWSEDTWTSRQLNYGYGFDSAFITISATGIPEWDELAGPAVGDETHWIPGASWDDQTQTTWNQGVYRPSTQDVLVYESTVADDEWWVSVLAVSSSNSDGSPKSCIAERVGIPVEGANGLAMITECWPEVHGDATLKVSIGGQLAADGPVTWSGPFDVQAGVTQSIDPRVTGRFIALKIESFEDARWSLGAMTFAWAPAGGR